MNEEARNLVEKLVNRGYSRPEAIRAVSDHLGRGSTPRLPLPMPSFNLSQPAPGSAAPRIKIGRNLVGKGNTAILGLGLLEGALGASGTDYGNRVNQAREEMEGARESAIDYVQEGLGNLFSGANRGPAVAPGGRQSDAATGGGPPKRPDSSLGTLQPGDDIPLDQYPAGIPRPGNKGVVGARPSLTIPDSISKTDKDKGPEGNKVGRDYDSAEPGIQGSGDPPGPPGTNTAPTRALPGLTYEAFQQNILKSAGLGPFAGPALAGSEQNEAELPVNAGDVGNVKAFGPANLATQAGIAYDRDAEQPKTPAETGNQKISYGSEAETGYATRKSAKSRVAAATSGVKRSDVSDIELTEDDKKLVGGMNLDKGSRAFLDYDGPGGTLGAMRARDEALDVAYVGGNYYGIDRSADPTSKESLTKIDVPEGQSSLTGRQAAQQFLSSRIQGAKEAPVTPKAEKEGYSYMKPDTTPEAVDKQENTTSAIPAAKVVPTDGPQGVDALINKYGIDEYLKRMNAGEFF